MSHSSKCHDWQKWLLKTYKRSLQFYKSTIVTIPDCHLIFFILFAANSLVRSWWYREAYIKLWQPNSPDTSQSGKISHFMCLVIQTVYTSFWATKYNVAVKDVLYIIWMLFVFVFFFLFAANSLVRSWWYREAYIKLWQPNSPDTSQSGKIFLFIYLVIQTVYTSFRTSKYNVAVRGIYLNVICFCFFLFAANSLIRSWWYREAYIKPWQPNSPCWTDTSQRGKVFHIIDLLLPTVTIFSCSFHLQGMHV